MKECDCRLSQPCFGGDGCTFKKDSVRRIVERRLGKKYTTLEEKETRKAAILKANFK